MTFGNNWTIAGTRRNNRFAAIFGLFALLCFQVSAASHQFEHVADEPQQACRVCVQQDRDADSLATPVVPAADILSGAHLNESIRTASADAAATIPCARGPPAFS